MLLQMCNAVVRALPTLVQGPERWRRRARQGRSSWPESDVCACDDPFQASQCALVKEAIARDGHVPEACGSSERVDRGQ